MANLKFSYLYRDAGNYKKYHHVIFDNPENWGLIETETIIRAKLIDGIYFEADTWLLPDLHFHQWDNDLDHTWHEFDSLTYTDESADFSKSLDDWFTHLINGSS